MSLSDSDIELPSDDDLSRLAGEVVLHGVSSGSLVGTAESCTGGLVAAALTSVSGSSATVRGGVVSYAIGVKHDVLGVSSDILDTPGIGAVSSECAEAMAAGARLVLSCDVAVSVTGIAGPTGAEPNKPVGSVWFGIASVGSTKSELHLFSGNRDQVRRKATFVALTMLKDALA